MKTVCIAGHCCSGKTTAIGIMANHLPGSAIVRGDTFLLAALLRYRNEFEEIYKIPLDTEKPYECFFNANNDASSDSVRIYRQFFNHFAPFIEGEIESAIAENCRRGTDFILVEYVSLPIFRTWDNADCRIMVVSKKEARKEKLRERTIAKYGSYDFREGFNSLREAAFAGIIEAAGNIDYIIENRYDEDFENELIRICRKLSNPMDLTEIFSRLTGGLL